MLKLNVNRKELENRLIAIIERVSGNPIVKNRLSITNQSLKILLHGSSKTSQLKNNEHNLDSFFQEQNDCRTHETRESCEISIISIIAEYDDISGKEKKRKVANFVTADNHQAVVKKLYMDIINYETGTLYDLVHRITSIKSLPKSVRNGIENCLSGTYEDLVDFLIDNVRNTTLISQSFIEKIISKRSTLVVHYTITDEKVNN